MLDVLDAVPIALAGTSFALGARHGLDWDHIAAITDLTAPRPGDAAAPAARQGRRGLALSAWYCTGHGLVLAVLGALVLLLGLQLPARLDVAFELVVGVTLVVLGGVVLYQLGRYRNDYRYSGRITLVVGALRRGWARARRREVPGDVLDVDRRGAFLVGLLHGTGAETPTQVALFAAAGASGSAGSAALVLGAFVAGLVVADLGIAAAWVSGLLGSRRSPRVQVVLGSGDGRGVARPGSAHPHRPELAGPRPHRLRDGPGLRGRHSCVSSDRRGG
jgi:high-affinity nickel-transport protein